MKIRQRHSIEVQAGSYKMLKQYWCYSILFFSLMFSNFYVSASDAEYDIKSAYIYQFTKYAEWPDRLFKSESDPLRICIQGWHPHSKSFNKITGKFSQKRAIVVEYPESLDQLSRCHVVFVSRSEEKRLDQILKRTRELPILTVSDIDGFASRGGIIGLEVVNKKIRLNINYNASKESGVRLSSKLLGIATLVKRR